MDDLVDGSSDDPEHDAQFWITQCSKTLDAKLSNSPDPMDNQEFTDPETKKKFNDLRSSLDLLPLSRLSAQPLYDLLKGFEMDLNFDAESSKFPIATETDLDLYASRVASTIAALVLELVFYHYQNESAFSAAQVKKLTQAGVEMGKALQCVNIARDIGRDAAIQRVYIPTTWLTEVGLTPSEVIRDPISPKLYIMQEKMLHYAGSLYSKSRAAMELLPIDVRGPIRTTVESYMEIGRELRRRKESILLEEKFRLPLWRRLLVAWQSMRNGPTVR